MNWGEVCWWLSFDSNANILCNRSVSTHICTAGADLGPVSVHVLAILNISCVSLLKVWIVWEREREIVSINRPQIDFSWFRWTRFPNVRLDKSTPNRVQRIPLNSIYQCLCRLRGYMCVCSNAWHQSKWIYHWPRALSWGANRARVAGHRHWTWYHLGMLHIWTRSLSIMYVRWMPLVWFDVFFMDWLSWGTNRRVLGFI